MEGKKISRSVNNEKQLELFDTIKSSLLKSELLSNKFRKSDFYEFEPNLKSINFSSVPYIVIKCPDTDPDILVMDQSLDSTGFDTSIILVMDYEARDNFKKYAQEILKQLKKDKSTFELKGYYDLRIKLVSSGVELIERQQVIAGIFNLTFEGMVAG